MRKLCRRSSSCAVASFGCKSSAQSAAPQLRLITQVPSTQPAREERGSSRLKFASFEHKIKSHTQNAAPPPAPAKNASFKHVSSARFLSRFAVATCKLGMMERALRRLFLRSRTASFELELQESASCSTFARRNLEMFQPSCGIALARSFVRKCKRFPIWNLICRQQTRYTGIAQLLKTWPLS